MAGPVDFAGIALVVAAVGVAVPSILAAVVSVISLIRQKEIHDLVNGQSTKINALAEAKGYAEGVADQPPEQKQPPPVPT